MTTLNCKNERRREQVRRQGQLFGLDYLKVADDQRTLTVHFLGKAPHKIDKDNVLIEGGRRIRDIRVLGAEVNRFDHPELDDTLEVLLDKAGDFSTYKLRIIERDRQGRPRPHPAFDPRYDSVEFGFKVDCPDDLDCKTEPQCPPVAREVTEIDYLAKDYSSFRQLMLDRLSLVMPGWKERHVPDIGIALVEVLAYVGDYLSYYQDAVATEAYLDTARQRISVRRHARLVDYQMHEGCNARTWVMLKTDSEEMTLDPRNTFFITGLDDSMNIGIDLMQVELERVPAGSFEVFEPMTGETINIFESHNKISFYTWGDDECCLDRGAVSATLYGELVEDDHTSDRPPQDHDPNKQRKYEGKNHEQKDYDHKSSQQKKHGSAPRLHLRPGDVLIFEEIKGPGSGNVADADLAHRHAVRLTRVDAATDPLNGKQITEIEWAKEDALPFTLCISSLGPPPGCKIIRNVSVARGNIIPADHGRTTKEELKSVPIKANVEECQGEGVVADTSVIAGRYRPKLKRWPLTFSQPLKANSPAARMLGQDVRGALPEVWLTSDPAPSSDSRWLAQHDLLSSLGDDQHFVVEIDDDRRAHLRFGDGELGRAPLAGMRFSAVYRVGGGTAGNVGAEAVSHIVFRENKKSGGITQVRNPLPATGATGPEPLAEVKLFAPHAFRRELRRAVVADDYASIVQHDLADRVQRAAATLRWNGSWYEALVAVDQLGKEEADAALLDDITRRLHLYRRISHDLTVKTARLVPLDIVMEICVDSHYLQGHVKATLGDLFSNRVLADGRKGFFHPDNMSFGDGIHLSRLVAIAQSVAGVESVAVRKFERLYEGPAGEIESGVLPLGPLEVPQMENDPSFPERGKLILTMGGGR